MYHGQFTVKFDGPFQQRRSCTRAVMLVALIAVASLPTGACAQTVARADTALHPPIQPPTGSVHDFDYHAGEWTAINRRLKQRWTQHPEWEEFPGRSRYVQYLGGVANVDEIVFPTKGWGGLTVRVFDRERRQWSIYWISSTTGTLGTPMIGGFQGNVGYFYGDDVDDGQPIKVRFIRTKRPPDGERWEQAFSRDGGRTWETNWTAEFTRVRASTSPARQEGAP